MTPIISRSSKSILLLGPRQVGKSTLVRGLNPSLTINLAREKEFLDHAQDASLLERLVLSKFRTEKVPVTAFVDEIQRLPSLLNTMQALLDEHASKVKFFLTGSSARKLKRGHANLLPGRIHAYNLGPLCSAEIDLNSAPERALATGTLPGIWTEVDQNEREKTLRTYSAVYLREEIQAESLSKNLEGFARFLGILGAWNGNFLDISKIAQASQVARTSVTRWFEIVEDTLIVRRVEAYSHKLSQRLVRHPKFYFFDTGVLNGLLNNFEPSADRIGVLFETLIFSQLISTAAAYDVPITVETFRTEAGLEVDFIVRLHGRLYAIETKASKRIGPHDLRALSRFAEIVREPCTRIILYLGEHTQEYEGVTVAPWASGLNLLPWNASNA